MSKEFSWRKIFTDENLQWLIVICSILLFTGFVCSRALASIGMISILVAALVFSNPWITFKNYFERKELLTISLFFWLVFISGFYSEDKAGWINWVRLKLPYLALPLAFARFKKLDRKKFLIVLNGFIAILFSATVFVLVNYFLNYHTITESLHTGMGIPMPYSRIRFTLMLTFSFFCAAYLLENESFIFNPNEKRWQVFVLVFSFIAIHILSVRSSLFALYLGLFFLLSRYIVNHRNLIQSMVLLLLLFFVPYTAQKLIPSLRSKMEYMRFDLQETRKGNLNNTSDGMRITSMKVGLEIAKKNVWLGVGAGDIRNEMERIYNAEYPLLNSFDFKLPHSQFVWVLASFGIVGFAIFLIAFFFPFFYNGIFKNSLAVILYLIIFSSFLTEATLEEQMGTGFYLIFLLLFINQSQKE